MVDSFNITICVSINYFCESQKREKSSFINRYTKHNTQDIIDININSMILITLNILVSQGNVF